MSMLFEKCQNSKEGMVVSPIVACIWFSLSRESVDRVGWRLNWLDGR